MTVPDGVWGVCDCNAVGAARQCGLTGPGIKTVDNVDRLNVTSKV
jgi:hypothetical protein